MEDADPGPEDDKKIAAFLCGCRGAVSRFIDLESIAKELEEDPDIATVSVHDALCSRDGQKFLKEERASKGFERVAVAACSPNIQGLIISRSLEDEGMNRYLFEQVNIREQCAWSHRDKERATEKARRLLQGAIARARELEPLEDIEVPILPSTLIIGGGVTGMQAALDIAGAGFKVHLVERSEELGGRAYKLSMTFPTHNCGSCCMQ